MSHQVVFTATARRDMCQIPPRIVAAVVELVYGDLAAAPRRVGKSLGRELTGSFSARRGPYRILYDIDDAVPAVHILRVQHRADVYRPDSHTERAISRPAHGTTRQASWSIRRRAASVSDPDSDG